MLQDIKVRVKKIEFDTIDNFGTCQSFSTGCNITREEVAFLSLLLCKFICKQFL